MLISIFGTRDLPGNFKEANGKPGNVAANEDEDNDGTDLGEEEVSSTSETSERDHLKQK